MTPRTVRRRVAWLATAATAGAFATGPLTVAAGPAAHGAAGEESGLPVVLVQANRSGPALSDKLTGANNDSWFDKSKGLWDYPSPTHPAGAPDPRVVQRTQQVGAHLVRYPGGTPANLFDWKEAIGPTEQRGCHPDGRPTPTGELTGEPRDSIYGPDEHMRFVDAAGAEAQIKVTFPNETPEDAGDWVEYMNGPVGANRNGGKDWAAERAANGHPAPYGVRYWEVGNEHDRPDQRYWMSADTDTALRQYSFGGTQHQQDQTLGKGCDLSSDVASDGSPSQEFVVAYPPVVPGSATVRIDGETWTQVADLSTADAEETVYELEPKSGTVTFGDGTHGAVPPTGTAVVADYDSGPHAGFVDFYRAMKEADPGIDVCATWAPITPETGLGGPGFPELMAATGNADDYDCLVAHPYTNFLRQFGDTFQSAQQGHDWHMLGEAEAARTFQTHVDAVRANAPARTYVTVSEFGALFFGPNNSAEYRSWNTAMSHATYFASQWTRFAEAGVPWAEGNTLVSETNTGLRGVLSGEPSFILTSEAVVRQALEPVVEAAGTVVDNRILNNPVEETEPTSAGSSYEALIATASRRADGGLDIVVVNRDSADPVLAQVVPAGYEHAPTAQVTTVEGHETDPEREAFESHNGVQPKRDEVFLERSVADVGDEAFRYTFEPHSVTVIRLHPV